MDKVKLLIKGHGGIIGYKGEHSRVEIPSHDLDRYLYYIEENGYAMDTTVIPDDRLIPLVVRGPMVNVDLEPNQVDRFKGMEELKLIKSGLQGGFHMLADLAERIEARGVRFGGFDYVSLPIYLALYRKAGARIGIRRKNKIAWEDGAVTEIREKSDD